MTRATTVRAVIALALVALAALLTATTPPNLGIDLKGGTQVVLETRDSKTADATAHTTDRTLEVLRQRVDQLGVTEPELVRSGDNRIIVDLPGLDDPDKAADVLGRTAQLTFHPVDGLATGADADSKDAKERGEGAQDSGNSKTDGKGTTDEASEKPGKDGKDGGKDGTGEDPEDAKVLRDESGEQLKLGASRLTGADVANAKAAIDQERGGGWFVDLELRDSGKDQWAKVTGEAACEAQGDPSRRVAIVLDGRIVSSPQIDPSVSCGHGITQGATQITGSFSDEKAKELAALIEGGALPVPVDVVEHRSVGPTLGADAISASAAAAVVGAGLTVLFVVFVYRLLGLLTAVGLLCYGLLAYAGLLAFDATLTLPGLAGFVLAIGMAIDANVLVFERAREAYTPRLETPDAEAPRGARSLRTALTRGFRGALGAIVDSNVTTVLAAGLLFFLAAGPVRGFGVTLVLGVVASMVSALVITRVLADAAVNTRWLRARPRLSGIAGEGRLRRWLVQRTPDWMRHGRRWLALGVVAVLLAGVGVALRGLEFGIDFTGGRLVEYTTTQPVDPDRARTALADAGLPDAVVQSSGGEDISVRTEQLTGAQQETVQQTLAELGGDAEQVRDELIGPSLGEELRSNALIALGLALGAQLCYLAFRFRWTFAVSSMVALAHDVALVVGVFAWLGRPVDGVFLAALLTVIGYSVNDSVVVFDRVRSEWAAEPRGNFRSLVNAAVVRTLPRTVNTGMGALFIVSALLFFGGDSLADFALALLVGLVVGSFSSLFIAAPLAIELEARRGKPTAPTRRRATRTQRTPRARDPRDTGARV